MGRGIGSGTQDDPYQISQPSELALLEELIREGEDTSYQSAYYVLTADIALNDVTDVEQWQEQGPEYSWRPITGGRFHLDGAGHTVRGMYINTNNETSDITQGSYGLLGNLWDGSVTDLTVEQSYVCVSGKDGQVGGIAGRATLSNVGSEAYMDRVGGDYLSTGDDANDPKNINREEAWLQVKDCTSTGNLDVNNTKEYPNEKGEVRYRNYFGGIIGNICAEEGFSIQVENCNYSGFERGLGNDDLPDVGASI